MYKAHFASHQEHTLWKANPGENDQRADPCGKEIKRLMYIFDKYFL
jgi:hypothetical protein